MISLSINVLGHIHCYPGTYEAQAGLQVKNTQNALLLKTFDHSPVHRSLPTFSLSGGTLCALPTTLDILAVSMTAKLLFQAMGQPQGGALSMLLAASSVTPYVIPEDHLNGPVSVSSITSHFPRD